MRQDGLGWFGDAWLWWHTQSAERFLSVPMAIGIGLYTLFALTLASFRPAAGLRREAHPRALRQLRAELR